MSEPSADTLFLISPPGDVDAIEWTDAATAGNAPHTITRSGSVVNSDTQKKFEPSAIYFDGAGDYLTLPDDPDWDELFGAGDFCVDLQIYMTQAAGAYEVIVNRYQAGTNALLIRRDTNKKLNVLLSTGAGWGLNATSTEAISDNAWHHLEVSRTSGTVYCFLDGVALTMSASAFAGTINQTSIPIRFGVEDTGTDQHYYEGYMSEIRLRNTGGHTSGFTPPSEPYIVVELDHRADIYLDTEVTSTYPEGWLSGWQNRIKITIDKDKIENSLTDFPLPLHLSASCGIDSQDISAIFDDLGSDANRKKIAFTISDGTTETYAEIEKWVDADEEAYIHVLVPSISSTEDTVIYMYYDVGHANNDSYIGDTDEVVAENVWDSNFHGVYHLNQDPNGDPANGIKDSTSNNRHGTPSGSMVTADLEDGQFGDSISFNGSTQFITLQGPFSPGGDDFCIEGLYYVDSFADRPIVSEWNTGNWDVRLGWGGGEADSLYFFSNGTDQGILAGPTVNAGQWQYISIRRVGTALFMRVDGGAEEEFQFDGPITGGGSNTYIARMPSFGALFPGEIDEVRLTGSDEGRSNEWTLATYYGLFDDLVTFIEEILPESHRAYIHLDTEIKVLVTFPHRADAYLDVEAWKKHRLDAYLDAEVWKKHRLDAILDTQIAEQFPHLEDIYLDVELWKTHRANAILDIQVMAQEHNPDFFLDTEIWKKHRADVYLYAEIAFRYSGHIRLETEAYKKHRADAALDAQIKFGFYERSSLILSTEITLSNNVSGTIRDWKGKIIKHKCTVIVSSLDGSQIYGQTESSPTTGVYSLDIAVALGGNILITSFYEGSFRGQLNLAGSTIGVV